MVWGKRKHTGPKLLMAVNRLGRQLARRMGWLAPAYHEEEGAAPRPGAHRHSLLYGGLVSGWAIWGAGLYVEFR